MKLLESVSMPTKRLKSPKFAKVSICVLMPSSLSRNHHAAPNCIFPGQLPSLKLYAMVVITSLSLGFRQYRIVFASFPEEASLSKKRFPLSAISRSCTES